MLLHLFPTTLTKSLDLVVEEEMDFKVGNHGSNRGAGDRWDNLDKIPLDKEEEHSLFPLIIILRLKVSAKRINLPPTPYYGEEGGAPPMDSHSCRLHWLWE
jgi:hypothetical protein